MTDLSMPVVVPGGLTYNQGCFGCGTWDLKTSLKKFDRGVATIEATCVNCDFSWEMVTSVPGPLDGEEDATVIFPSTEGVKRDSAWLTLKMGVEGWKPLSLRIIRTDEGVVLDLYVLGEEDMEPIAATWAVAKEDFMEESE